jgi:hypothetical protein
MCQIQLGTWVAGVGQEPPIGWPPVPIPVNGTALVGQYIDGMSPLQYDLAPVEQDNALGRLEVLVPILLNNGLPIRNVNGRPESVAYTILRPAALAPINNALAAVPNNASLFDPAFDDDNAAIWAALTALFTPFLGVRWVGWATATKILHKKRPRLVPVADGKVVDATGTRFGYGWLVNPGTPAGLVEVVRRIRADIMFAPNLAALNTLRASVPALDGLTIVRIFDMVVWQAAQDGLLGGDAQVGFAQNGGPDPSGPSGPDPSGPSGHGPDVGCLDPDDIERHKQS